MNDHVTNDLAVGRNVNIGNKMEVQGDAVIHHNLRVHGFFDADNIKSHNKGIFFTVDDLKRAYPNPESGDYARVGTGDPLALYLSRNGQWVNSGQSMLETTDWEAIGDLQDTLRSVQSALTESQNTVAAQATQIESLVAMVSGITGTENVKTVALTTADVSKGSVTGGGVYVVGKTVTITATPASGYTFVKWSDNNTNPVRTITIANDVQLSAVFTQATFVIGAKSSDLSKGTVTGGGVYAAGSTATVVATGASGCTFEGWYEGSKMVSSQASFSFVVKKDSNLVAKFSDNTVYPIDYYIGFAQCTVNEFEAFDTSQLLSNATGYRKRDSVHYTGTFTKQAVYVLFRSVSAPTKAVFNANTLPTEFSRADMNDKTQWAYKHSSIVIEGETYYIVGFGSTQIETTDTIDIYF